MSGVAIAAAGLLRALNLTSSSTHSEVPVVADRERVSRWPSNQGSGVPIARKTSRGGPRDADGLAEMAHVPLLCR